ncbi:MAG: isopenicillin N synthase family oxygenase [Bdellovibrionales bacterium]|nr:isopenicillin N synthase family oxygenase [Bdellovibrionales bacterium]
MIPKVSLQDRDRAVVLIREACRTHGFFSISDFGVDPYLFSDLEKSSREFFSQAQDEKMQIEMSRAGIAWRGYFPLGAELTSGRPDLKEGLYFGSEGPKGSIPLHGPNLFPNHPKELQVQVLRVMKELTGVGHTVMELIALGLNLPTHYFRADLTQDPLILFRIFHYPAPNSSKEAIQWGVGEHTDYGLLTLLWQDENGGLEVKTPSGWTEVPPEKGTLICNIGDMLDLMTGGLYRSTLHRVKNRSGKDRLSMPFFFDPGFFSHPKSIPGTPTVVPGASRWDGQDLHAFQGTYGEYLVKKVSKVFPGLATFSNPRSDN